MENQKEQKEIFSDWLGDDTISVSINLEDEDMNREAMFHNHYAIYLFCTVEKEVAERILAGDITAVPIPLKLYETKEISKAMATNVNHKNTLKVAINLFNNNRIFYDSLIMDKNYKNKVKERYNYKTDQDFFNNCLYIRRLVKCESTGTTVIEYTINDANIMSSPQYANTM